MTPSYTKKYQGPATAQCDTCDGYGYISQNPGIDACPACAARAEAVYMAGLATPATQAEPKGRQGNRVCKPNRAGPSHLGRAPLTHQGNGQPAREKRT